ncbi:hypothetical protein CB0940_05657 [Cercospora beticola]|uniref:Cytochrome c oxidase assembly protein COX20, mitochondrial n=2 Tax=Cercospora TaxID=29002 RepID=A0A2G5HXR4_CERBT|nr:hypothetical protein CB0940_05657 [Cercospora beticola]XP_044652832.1 uncharacterized protein CKM354_000176500 [Cercospora kikuchii]PIA97354.1 hypothetical protein CB0940_05657 [Cercospora beticola]WPA98227.1 hypothetical protein RHO25_002839 [Cercospora beticola]CAK1359450.1 unnamed protein product [Cercospora beticola]GIZ38345.1 hypothetical protein CKM354_000176500 [Cercospora kikuchii]
MADDTRQSNTSPKEDLSKEALTVHPENKPFSGSQWQTDPKAQTIKPPENANLMSGGTQHTAGGKEPEFNLKNVLTTGRPITEVHKAPCVRDSLLQGMGAGGVIGATRAIFGTPVWKSCNWAVGSFCVAAFGMYQYCLYQRQSEKEGMIRAMEILDKKRLEKQMREERKQKLREERRAAKEKELDAQYQAASDKQDGKAWYKFW